MLAAVKRAGARGVLTLLATLMALLAAPAQAAGRSDAPASDVGRNAFDLAVLRPLQLVQVVVHAAVFVPIYPISLPFGGGEGVLDLCITKPMERFTRPIGEL